MERGTPGYELVDKTEDLLLSIGRKLGIQNPFAAQQAVIKENREGRDPDSIYVDKKENIWINQAQKDVIDIGQMFGAGYASAKLAGMVPSTTVPKLPPRSNTNMINVTPRPDVLPSGVKGGALTKTQYPRTQTKLEGGRTFIDSPSIGTYIVGPQDKGFAAWLARNPKGTLQQYTSIIETYNKLTNPNYNPIVGSDELTETFKSQWLTKAKTGQTTYYYDITDHRMLRVPGMQSLAQQTRYKSWLTQQLINRINTQSRFPEEPMNRFLGQSFYDTQGMEWRLVRTETDEFGYKSGSGPLQAFEPMPLNEIDSRKLKAKNTSDEEKVILRELIKKEVKQRNAIEKQNPWLIEWNADTTGQNYHEHMIGLDESEFWNSGAGKAEGYMNNDVYNLEKGLGNIVALRDPRFKLMKDIIADYITPRGKTEIYPGLKKRTKAVKKFTSGPYKGMNAVIGYDANPKSKDFTNLTIRAYNPDPNINESKIVATIPNWYANVYAKDLTTGKHIVPEDIANDFVQSYVDAVLAGDEPGIVALEDLGEELFKKYGISKEIPAPGGLQQDPEYQSLGEAALNKKPFDKRADEATFKTTPRNQRLIDKWWKKNLNYWQKGDYTQLDFYNKLK